MAKSDDLPNPFVVVGRPSLLPTVEEIAPDLPTDNVNVTLRPNRRDLLIDKKFGSPRTADFKIDQPDGGGGGGTFVPIESYLATRHEQPIESSKLVENFNDAMSILRAMFKTDEDSSVGQLHLDTMEVNLEVTAEGKLAFLGTGGSLSGKTSFKLTFKKPGSDK